MIKFIEINDGEDMNKQKSSQENASAPMETIKALGQTIVDTKDKK